MQYKTWEDFMQYKTCSKQIGTAQGTHTLISLLGCAILGMVLSRILPFLIGKLRPNLAPEVAEEIGVLVALGISGVLLIISLLKPRKPSISPLRRQLLKGKVLKENEKSDGI